MCTLALALRTDRRWPIVVAANRDERLGRAAEGWALREPPGAPRFAAPRDLTAEDAAAWNPFHLVVADAERAFLWRYDGDRAAVDDLPPGLHVVTESTSDGRGPRGEIVRARWPLDHDVARLRDLLALHAPARAEAVCIHGDPLYGTRSSAVLRLAPALQHGEVYAADGHPCVTPFEDRSRLLQDLARSP
jgi:hypothetical protein